jgi:hypothetical protein
MERFYRGCIATLISCALLVGCSTLSKKNRTNELDETLKYYNTALRWGHYDTALGYCRPPEGGARSVDGQYLENIRVTGVVEKSRVLSDDASRVLSKVEYRFYHVDQARENRVLDEQTWVYDEESGQWLLEGSLPDFRIYR